MEEITVTIKPIVDITHRDDEGNLIATDEELAQALLDTAGAYTALEGQYHLIKQTASHNEKVGREWIDKCKKQGERIEQLEEQLDAALALNQAANEAKMRIMERGDLVEATWAKAMTAAASGFGVGVSAVTK